MIVSESFTSFMLLKKVFSFGMSRCIEESLQEIVQQNSSEGKSQWRCN